MNLLVYITMFGWIPVVISLFARFKPRHAVIVAFLSAWLFLPLASFPIKGLPDYTKMSATCWGIFLSACFFDQKRFLSFKPGLIDIPIIMWCICPLFSSLNNNLGVYDGLSESLNLIVTWGFPYLIGRLYFNDLESQRELAVGILVGGLIYIPLCMIENVMSPQLHRWVYGYHQASFAQTFRMGGWRPMVFMRHGLMVGVWMMSASLISFWLWKTGALKNIGRIPAIWAVLALFTTSVLVRSTGAIMLLMMGVGFLVAIKVSRSKLIVVCLILIPILYISTRSTGVWDGYNLQIFVAENISYDRAMSLWTRMDFENMLAEKALERPVFGWGGWGRSRIYDELGNDITLSDGLWIIIFGKHGLFGLAFFTMVFLLPICIFLRNYPAASWSLAKVAPGAVLSLLIGLYMIDNLLNAMINPIFTAVAGGLAGAGREQLFQNKISFVKGDKTSEKPIAIPRFL